MAPKPPPGLAPAGRELWRQIVGLRDFNAGELAKLHEACRLKDRLDRFDKLLSGDIDAWAEIQMADSDGPTRLVISSVVTEARLHAGQFRQLLDSLHLAVEEAAPSVEAPVDPLAAARDARAARKARASGL